jgi:hypothetical protein
MEAMEEYWGFIITRKNRGHRSLGRLYKSRRAHGARTRKNIEAL